MGVYKTVEIQGKEYCFITIKKSDLDRFEEFRNYLKKLN